MSDKGIIINGNPRIDYDDMPPAAQKEFDDFQKIAESPFLTVDQKWEKLGPHFEKMRQLIFS